MTNKLLKELMNLPLTDFGNALRLQAIFGKRWVYLPRFKSWMYRDLHSWKGKRTLDAIYAASRAFHELVQEIYCLPVPQEERERDRLERIIDWLLRSEGTSRVRHAVYMYRDMQLAEAAVREDVLRNN